MGLSVQATHVVVVLYRYNFTADTKFNGREGRMSFYAGSAEMAHILTCQFAGQRTMVPHPEFDGSFVGADVINVTWAPL